MTFTGRESETLSLFQNALTSFSSFSFFSSCLQVSSLLASAARTPLPAAVGAAAKRRVSSSSGGGGGGVSGGKKKAATATTEAKSGRGSGGRGLAAVSLLLLLLGAAATVLFSATSTHPLAARLSESLSPVSTAASELFYEASARAGPARRRAAEALEALRDRWSERARRAAAAAARARAGAASAPAVVEADSAATGAAAETTAASAAAAAAAAAAASAAATQQAETPTPTPALAPPAPSADAAAPAKSTRPCSRSLSPTLVDFLLPAGPAWDGARAAVAAAFQGTRTAAAAAAAEPGGGDGDEDAASSSPSSTSASLHHPPTKATAVLLAAWSDEAREAALGLIEAALPQECVHSSPSPMACYLRFQPFHRDAATGEKTAATAGDLQALLTAFLKACPHGIVTVPSAHELPPSATAVLINALSEGGGFEAADGSGHVPAGGALFIGTAAAPPSLPPTTEDEVALVLGAKRALADGLAARGTEAVAADALRRRWDVVAPVIEDEAEEEGSKGGEERE